MANSDPTGKLPDDIPVSAATLREALLQCGPFDDNASLRALFARPSLQPWRSQVPDGQSRADRVDRTVDLLHDQFAGDGAPALALFLEEIAASLHPDDACHSTLLELASALRRPPEPAPGAAPYKGLHYYDSGDASHFFGREALTAQIVQQLSRAVGAAPGHARPFLAVVGASGSGKSSVVRAGLIPALLHGRALEGGVQPPAGSSRWLVQPITPSDQPFKALARPLAGWLDAGQSETAQLVEANRLAAALQAGDVAIDDVARRIQERESDRRILLVVDQFEELFTLCNDEVLRRAFVDQLVAAVAPETAGRTVAVIVLRADFYHRCADFEGLRSLLAQRQIYIGPLSQEEMRRAIEGPAERFGWKLEEGLVARILDDVGEEPGALPLLSHALHETWRRRSGRTLTHAGYGAAGGVRGAIARTAEAAYRALSAEDQALARDIFLRLVELGERGPGAGAPPPDSRGRASRTELLTLGAGPDRVQGVLDRLAAQRLITVAEESVEVAHEALIRQWPRLQEWLDSNRERLRRHEELAEAAARWLALERDPGALLRGAPLALAEALAADDQTALTAPEAEYLRASLTAIAAEQRARLAARQRVRRGALFGLLAGALIFGAVFLLMALQQSALAYYAYLSSLLGLLTGALAGLLLVVGVDLLLAFTSGRSRWLRALAGGLAGAFAFLLPFFYQTLIVAAPGDLLVVLPGALVQGALLGLVAGLGRVWLRRERLPRWQSLPAIAAAGALALVLGEQVGGTFAGASLASIALAGAAIPLAILGAAELASATREDRAAMYGEEKEFLV
jgi:hypothetical protein